MSTVGGIVKWWKEFQSHQVLLLMIVGAVFFSGFSVNDNYLMQEKMPEVSDPLIGVAAYLSVGAVIGVLLHTFLLATALGKIVDADHNPNEFRHGVIDRKALLCALAAGAIGSIATAATLWAYQGFSAAIVRPMAVLSLVLIILWENKNSLKRMFLMVVVILLLFLGVTGVSLSPFISTTGPSFDSGKFMVLFLVFFLGANIVTTVDELLGKEGSRNSNGAVFSFWRFVALTVTGVIIATGYSAYVGLLGEYVRTMWEFVKSAWLSILLTMMLVFPGMGWKQTAKRYTTAGVVNVYYTMVVFFTPVLTLIFRPGIENGLPKSPEGVVLMVVSVIAVFIATLLSVSIESQKSPRQMFRDLVRPPKVETKERIA